MDKTKPETAPASVQGALNYRYFMDRLDEPGLLDRAIVTEDNDLAVPVGGKRLGGYCGAISRAVARRTVRQLAARPEDFPGARYFYGEGCGWLVEWGPEFDWCDDVTAGRYFGYSDAAIEDFGRMMAMRDLEEGAE